MYNPIANADEHRCSWVCIDTQSPDRTARLARRAIGSKTLSRRLDSLDNSETPEWPKTNQGNNLGGRFGRHPKPGWAHVYIPTQPDMRASASHKSSGRTRIKSPAILPTCTWCRLSSSHIANSKDFNSERSSYVSTDIHSIPMALPDRAGASMPAQGLQTRIGRVAIPRSRCDHKLAYNSMHSLDLCVIGLPWTNLTTKRLRCRNYF